MDTHEAEAARLLGQSESPSDALSFRDQSARFQHTIGWTVGGGLGLAFASFKAGTRNEEPMFYAVAGVLVVVTLIAAGLIYLKFGKPVELDWDANGLRVRRGKKTSTAEREDLFGFAASWTDVLKNGVYQHTLVKFRFYADHLEEEIRYDATVTHGTEKHQRLERFQDEVAALVAQRLARILEDKGRVAWTERLTLCRDGVEFAKRGSTPELIPWEQVGRCQIDQGRFKLAVGEESRPRFTESVADLNFFPGLIVFESQLGGESLAESGAEDPCENYVIGSL